MRSRLKMLQIRVGWKSLVYLHMITIEWYIYADDMCHERKCGPPLRSARSCSRVPAWLRSATRSARGRPRHACRPRAPGDLSEVGAAADGWAAPPSLRCGGAFPCAEAAVFVGELPRLVRRTGAPIWAMGLGTGCWGCIWWGCIPNVILGEPPAIWENVVILRIALAIAAAIGTCIP